MTVMITIPDRIEHQLRAMWGGDLPRRALEALALEGYRTGALSTGQVAEMLNMSIDQVNGFLRAHGAEQPLSLEQYRQDQAVLERLLA